MNYVKVHDLLLLSVFNSTYSMYGARIIPHREGAGVLFLNVSDKVYVIMEEEKCSKYSRRLFMLFLSGNTFFFEFIAD